MLGNFSYEERLSSDHVRLLAISPDEAASPIRCTLLPFKLTDIDGRYVALSYVWGTLSPSQDIVCNGMGLKITESLHAALWQYRQDKNDKLIWADAVCINQNDIQEKTEQVRIMQVIYSKAFQVLLWLGPAEESDAEAFEFLHQIAVTEIEDEITGGVLDCARYGFPSRSDPIWDTTLSLLKRPWFGRAWVIQEMAVNANTRFRKGVIDMEASALLKASVVGIFYNMHALGQLPGANHHDPGTTDPNPVKGPLFEDIRDTIQNGRTIPLHQLLMMSRLLKTSEPKDKIFALAGLADNRPPDFVDYDKSLDEIIIEVARQAIHRAESNPQSHWSVTNLLSHACPSQERMELPSWAVDFSDLNNGHHALSILQIFDESSTALSPWKFVPSELDGPAFQNLGLRGLGRRVDGVVSMVEGIQVPYPMMISYYDIVLGALTLLMWFEDVEQMIDEHCTAYPGADIQEILWRTLVCDCIQVGTRATVEDRAYYDSFRMYLLCRTIIVRENPFRYERNFLLVEFGLLMTASWIILSKFALRSSTRLQGWSGLAGYFTALGISLWAFATALKSVPTVYNVFAANQEADLHAKNITPLLGAFHRYHNTRKFFASENGRLGLLPRSANEGDHIFVFPESSIPFVLRRCSGGYRILGDCYMHGMMDGQSHGDLDGFESIDIL